MTWGWGDWQPGGTGSSYTSTINPWMPPGTDFYKRPTVPSTPVTYVYNTYNAAPNPTPVSPPVEPKIEANQLYGKAMALAALGFARIGSSPAPIVGPYLDKTAGTVSFMVSFGVPANPAGNRRIYAIYLDNELVWSSVAGGTTPGEGTFAAESFDFRFYQGRLDQPVDALETQHFPGDECAYRPQMLMSIRNIKYKRFMDNTGKPVPYVAVDVGDVTDGADPHDGINLGEGLERIAYSPWVGYTASDPDTVNFEAVGITDVVDAILIKDNFDIIQLCKSITREYRNIDLLVSDKIRVKDRGASVSPNFRFNRNSIISDDNAINVTRAGATAQKREFELLAIDPAQDYTAVPSLSQIPRNPMVISTAVGKDSATIPLVIDADTRQALATFTQNYEENARRTVALKLPASGYQIEPGDLFALTDVADGFDNEVFKCTSTSHGANWMVEIEGEAILRCSIYHEPTPGMAVFASGDDGGAIRYCYVDGTAPQEWHGRCLWNAGDGLGGGWPFYAGGIVASSYAKPGGVPTFLMGGNDFVFANFGNGIMMVSHDAMSWTLVFRSGTHRAIENLVWDAQEEAFYADSWGISDTAAHVCLRSGDGHVWEEVPDDFWAHTADGITPDGRVGYDRETGLTIRPEDLDIGFTVRCVAYANGIWMAAGVSPDDTTAVTATSLDGGTSWSVVTSGAIPDEAYNGVIRSMVAAPQSDITG